MPMTNNQHVRLFLSGDVMTGRGIDQVLPYPNDPRIYESYVRDARDYVELSERKYGEITAPVSFSYIWGAALNEFKEIKPDARLINLETTISKAEEWVPKGINYRMHPDNIGCLTAANI